MTGVAEWLRRWTPKPTVVGSDSAVRFKFKKNKNDSNKNFLARHPAKGYKSVGGSWVVVRLTIMYLISPEKVYNFTVTYLQQNRSKGRPGVGQLKLDTSAPYQNGFQRRRS